MSDGASVSVSASACASSAMPLGCCLLHREIHTSASDHRARLPRKRPLPAHELATFVSDQDRALSVSIQDPFFESIFFD
jgi:hypothetical protein